MRSAVAVATALTVSAAVAVVALYVLGRRARARIRAEQRADGGGDSDSDLDSAKKDTAGRGRGTTVTTTATNSTTSTTKTTTTPGRRGPVRVPIPKDVREPTSFANFHEVLVTDIALHLRVDFTKRVLSGTATLQATVLREGATELVLDTSGISVTEVHVNDAPAPAKHSFAPRHAVYGSALHVPLPEDAASRAVGADVVVSVRYATAPGPKCSATQWLPAEQTAGKVHPYLFTQNQAIHCRSMIPCQDAPAVKTTFSAAVTVPKGLVALMSAVAEPEAEAGAGGDLWQTFRYRQEVPVPSYLIALAVGDLESREVGPRSRVWAEPSVVDKAAFEFAETETFLATAESICGAYVWGRYDILVMPPSFGYGGMENACLTFLTPTLMAGDRSLCNVLAHEIAHSWSGNLVTNATWSDFWLNEGFTVFIERRIVQKMSGRAAASLKQCAGWKRLESSVQLFGAEHKFTRLHIDMECEDAADGIDPDDAFSAVPYEKGAAFLLYLEAVVGGEAVFERFLKAYVLRFQYGGVTWERLRVFFEQYFREHGTAQDKLDAIDWQRWVHAPGMPDYEPPLDTTLLDAVEKAADRCVAGSSATTSSSSSATTSSSSSATASLSSGVSPGSGIVDSEKPDPGPPTPTLEAWSSDQKVNFLEMLQDRQKATPFLSGDVLDRLDASFDFSTTVNSEVRFRWCLLCLGLGDGPRAQDEKMVVRFLGEQGRMKFVRPLYRALAACSPAGDTAARAAFESFRLTYSSVTSKMIERDFAATA